MYGSTITDPATGRPIQRRVALLDLDPDLAAGLPRADRARAAACVSAALRRLPAGPWIPRPEDLVGPVLVASGLIVRETLVAGVPASELLGPGDVVAVRPAARGLLDVSRSWSVMVPTRIVVLDGIYAAGAARWPAIDDAVRDRLEEQLERASVHGAIRQLRRVEDRLVAIFAELAARWGRVGPDGLIVPVPLTHQALGRLIGAERPTVSLALAQLRESGLLLRRDDGAWLLARAPSPV